VSYETILLIFFISVTSFSSCFAQAPMSQNSNQEDLLKYTAKDYELLKSIVAKIAITIGKQPSDYKITIRQAKDFNASATLGRQLTVNSSLFHLLKTEAGLATIVAHEIGHIERSHVVKGMTTAIATSIVGSTIGVLSGSNYGASAARDVSSIAIKAHSRSQERSADLFAIDIINRLYCSSPGKIEGYKYMLSQDRSADYTSFLRTHPLPQTRLKYMIKLIEDSGCEV
jgi:beta-barrel assembly-enhancing protease